MRGYKEAGNKYFFLGQMIDEICLAVKKVTRMERDWMVHFIGLLLIRFFTWSWPLIDINLLAYRIFYIGFE